MKLLRNAPPLQELIILVNQLDLHDCGANPVDFLGLINLTLRDSYVANQEDRTSISEFIHTLHGLFRSTPLPFFVALVEAIQDGICIWIRDEKAIMTTEDYNIAVSDPASFDSILLVNF